MADLGWFEPQFEDVFQRCRPHTLTSPARMYALWKAVDYICRAGIPGAFVECGVWRGGSVLVMIDVLVRRGIADRDVYLFDTFAGMTEPGENDIDYLGQAPGQDSNSFDEWNRRYSVGIDEVRHLLDSTGYPANRIHLVEGDVMRTLPALAPDRIALLRLDTDWYDSTKHELETLYPRLVSRGVLIVDDYGHWAGARRATDGFFDTLLSPPLLNRIDYTGRLAIKVDA